MKRTVYAILTILMGLSGRAMGQGETQVSVLSERVNLRAKADKESEVVGQVNQGESLKVKSFQDQWVEIVPPEKIDLWVHRDFIKENMVTASKLYVRAGASINYSIVGTLKRGDVVVPKGEFGEWIRISPPAACSLWVSRDLVQAVQPQRPSAPVYVPTASGVPVKTEGPVYASMNTPTPVVTPSEPVQPVPTIPSAAGYIRTSEEVKPEAPKAPSDLVLVPLEGQGRTVKRDGILKNVGFVIGRPSSFRLVQMDGNRIETICYVRGNSGQLNNFLNRRLVIQGREYWAQGVKHPVVLVEQIAPQGTP